MIKIPQRTCMGCNCKKEKKDFVRLVINNANKLEVDFTKKQDGRGAYICNDETCLNKVIKNRRLERVFKIKLEANNYEDIRGMIFGKK